MNREKAESYIRELIKWNKKVNLISKNDFSYIYERHFKDSLKILKFIPKNVTLLDIGSGNGLPAIPVAIYRKDISVYAMEPNLKKTIFLKHIKDLLKLSNFNIIRNRVGDNNPDYRSYFNVITSRALSSISFLIKNSQYYARKRHILIAFKSCNNNELENLSTKCIKIIHNVEKSVYKLIDKRKRQIICITVEKQ